MARPIEEIEADLQLLEENIEEFSDEDFDLLASELENELREATAAPSPGQTAGAKRRRDRITGALTREDLETAVTAVGFPQFVVSQQLLQAGANLVGGREKAPSPGDVTLKAAESAAGSAGTKAVAGIQRAMQANTTEASSFMRQVNPAASVRDYVAAGLLANNFPELAAQTPALTEQAKRELREAGFSEEEIAKKETQTRLLQIGAGIAVEAALPSGAGKGAATATKAATKADDVVSANTAVAKSADDFIKRLRSAAKMGRAIDDRPKVPVRKMLEEAGFGQDALKKVSKRTELPKKTTLVTKEEKQATLTLMGRRKARLTDPDAIALMERRMAQFRKIPTIDTLEEVIRRGMDPERAFKMASAEAVAKLKRPLRPSEHLKIALSTNKTADDVEAFLTNRAFRNIDNAEFLTDKVSRTISRVFGKEPRLRGLMDFELWARKFFDERFLDKMGPEGAALARMIDDADILISVRTGNDAAEYIPILKKLKPKDHKGILKLVASDEAVRDSAKKPVVDYFRNKISEIRKAAQEVGATLDPLPRKGAPDNELVNWLANARHRITDAEMFGPRNRNINRLLAEMRQKNPELSEVAGWLVQRALGMGEPQQFQRISRFIRSWQAISKLQVAAITNFGDFLKPLVFADGDMASAIKSIFWAIAPENLSAGARASRAQALRSGATTANLRALARETGSTRVADFFLRKSGFQRVELKVREAQALTGINYADTLAARLQKTGIEKNPWAARRLGELVGFDNLDTVVAEGRVASSKLRDLVGARAIAEMQPFGRLSTPGLYANPLGRVAFQFKTFALKQMRFTQKYILREATQNRNLRPLITFTIGAQMLGEPIADVKAALRHGDTKAAFRERPTDLFNRMIDNMLQVGGIGLVTDFLTSVRYNKHSPISGFFLGPAVQDLTDVTIGAFNSPRAAEAWLIPPETKAEFEQGLRKTQLKTQKGEEMLRETARVGGGLAASLIPSKFSPLAVMSTSASDRLLEEYFPDQFPQQRAFPLTPGPSDLQEAAGEVKEAGPLETMARARRRARVKAKLKAAMKDLEEHKRQAPRMSSQVRDARSKQFEGRVRRLRQELQRTR